MGVTMGWREQFKAGWSAAPGAWQRKPSPGWQPSAAEPRPQWQEEPAAPDAVDELSRELAESKSVVAGLMHELEERDAELEQRRAFADEQVLARQAVEEVLAQANERLTKFEAATPALMRELEEAGERLAAAEADRDRYETDLAAGMTPALCRRFLRAALIVLHPDKYHFQSAVADIAAFVEARYRELEEEVAKIARSK